MHLGKQLKRKNRNKSSPHTKALSLLEKLFPNTVIYEEITIPDGLYLDLFIPSLDLIVEVHGKQHYEFVPFFHKTKANFLIAKKRDRDKIEWATLNKFSIAILPYNEEDKWESIISKTLQG